MTSDQIRTDFDRIAELQRGVERDNNHHYHHYLLSQLPPVCSSVLDIGSGTGDFARELATRSAGVVAVDLSPRMIARAREHPPACTNIDYLVQDVTEWDWPVARFDAIVSIATLHHLPLGQTLRNCCNALRPGGVLAIVDLCRPQTIADYVTFALAYPVNRLMRLRLPQSSLPSPQLRVAFAAHGQHDRYPTLSEVRCAAAEAKLHDARVRRHLLWRYSLVWKKPMS